jgi:hypothetical protein
MRGCWRFGEGCIYFTFSLVDVPLFTIHLIVFYRQRLSSAGLGYELLDARKPQTTVIFLEICGLYMYCGLRWLSISSGWSQLLSRARKSRIIFKRKVASMHYGLACRYSYKMPYATNLHMSRRRGQPATQSRRKKH